MNLRLNLGCGFKKLENFVNVDKQAICRPDLVVDLEALPWPWQDNSVDEIVMDHVLEHMGERTDTYIGIIREIYRICRHGARVHINVPHPRSDTFVADPTHVRPITAEGLAMFDQTRNLQDYLAGGQETKLGLFTGVDFKVAEVGYDLFEPWKTQVSQGTISMEKLNHEAAHLYNVVVQIRVILEVQKPGRCEDWIREQGLTR